MVTIPLGCQQGPGRRDESLGLIRLGLWRGASRLPGMRCHLTPELTSVTMNASMVAGADGVIGLNRYVSWYASL